jgi:hypothetical protein
VTDHEHIHMFIHRVLGIGLRGVGAGGNHICFPTDRDNVRGVPATGAFVCVYIYMCVLMYMYLNMCIHVQLLL